MTKYEVQFDMACDGCYKAAQRVLGKVGVTDVTADVPNKILWVTCDKSSDEVKELLEKTGKSVNGIKEV